MSIMARFRRNSKKSGPPTRVVAKVIMGDRCTMDATIIIPSLGRIADEFGAPGQSVGLARRTCWQRQSRFHCGVDCSTSKASELLT